MAFCRVIFAGKWIFEALPQTYFAHKCHFLSFSLCKLKTNITLQIKISTKVAFFKIEPKKQRSFLKENW